jgi:translocation and assembly module TamA
VWPAIRGQAAAGLWLLGLPAALAQAPLAQAPFAQTTPPPVDPLGDLAPLPGLGIDWPDPARIGSAGATTTPEAAAPDRVARYRVVLAGADALGEGFRTRFNGLSALVAGEAKPANAAQLERRAAGDRDLLAGLLQAAGHYDGAATSRVEPARGVEPATVRLTLVPGPAYRFTAVELPGLGAGGAAATGLAGRFAVRTGDRVDADAVLAAAVAFKAELGREGFPFAALGDPHVTADHLTHGAVLSLPVTPGGRASFGRLYDADARPIFSERHLRTVARFRPGDPYDSARLDDLRRALIATGLVSTATVIPVATADPRVVDVRVRIDRAPARTVAAELGYGTGQGARIALSWEHRNLLPPEGAVTFSGVGGTREQSLGATLRRGNLAARDRVLTAQAVFSHSDYDAYDARTLTIGGNLERQTNIIWQKKWVWSGGAEVVATDERDTDIDTAAKNRRQFLILAVPGSLAYDGTDDLLNPTRRWRLSGHLSPEWSLHAGSTRYVRAQIDASAYLPVGSRLVLAGRIRVATIVGADREDIAPSRRLYSGGGGSVRGFGYQDLGPKAPDGTPVGGRGLTEFGTEARFRFGNFGVVPFLDWGSLVTGSTPSFDRFRFGTGLGVRYYSSFGPIRVDVGTPVNRERGDSRVALYVSLGQAF